MEWNLFFFAVTGLIFVHVTKGLRWQFILKCHGLNYSFITCYLIYLSGCFIGIATPGRIGDFIKLFYLKNNGVAIEKAVLVNLIDRIADICIVATFGFLALILLDQYIHIKIGFLFFLIIGGGAAALVTVKYVGLDRLKKGLTIILGRKYGPIFENGLTSSFSDLKKYNLRKIALIAMYSTGGLLIYVGVIYILSIAIGLDFPFLIVVFILVVSTLVAFIPISIAGVGTRDISLIMLLSAFGYSKEAAVSVSALFLIIYFLTLLFGFIAWSIKPVSKVH